jgi:hypothetical protein
MSPEESLELFLEDMKKKYSFLSSETRALLKKHGYAQFKVDNIVVYDACIRQEWLARAEQAELRKKELEEQAKKQTYHGVPCPLCGAQTFGDVHWFGKYTRKPGWTCSKGGVRHFLINKANDIMKNRGIKPISLEAFDNYGKHFNPNPRVQVHKSN